MIGLSDPGASRAVLIGVHDYQLLADLPAVERNLTGLREVFTNAALWGLDERHCVLIPQPESARTILDTFQEVAAEATDTLVLYFAGHGLIDPYTEELCLALPDSDPERPYTTLRYEYLRRLVLDVGIQAPRKIVILDCCYSGRALLGGMSATTQVADQAVVDGTYLLTASAESHKAVAPPGEKYTAFTGELISTLRDGIPGGPELLDMETVYRQLRQRLAARSRPVPQQRNRNAGGLIAIVHNTAGSGVESASGTGRHPLDRPHADVVQTEMESVKVNSVLGREVLDEAISEVRRNLLTRLARDLRYRLAIAAREQFESTSIFPNFELVIIGYDRRQIDSYLRWCLSSVELPPNEGPEVRMVLRGYDRHQVDEYFKACGYPAPRGEH